MSERTRETPGGFQIDLSTGTARSGTRPRKGPPAVVVQTINLSTPKPPRPEAPATPAALPAVPAAAPKRAAAPPKHSGGSPGARRKAPRDTPRGGHGLADLLDETTLARLRGLG